MTSHETSSQARESAMGESLEPIACDLTAIPVDQRPAHVAFVRSLISGSFGAVRETADGLHFELPPNRLAEVARFVDNERRCCGHLAFALEAPPREVPLTLRVTGPGAREELHALGR